MLKFLRRSNSRQSAKDTRSLEPQTSDTAANLSKNIEENVTRLKSVIQMNMDAVFREVQIGGREDLRAMVIYFQGLIDTDRLNRDVLQPLLFKVDLEQISAPQIMAKILDKQVLAVGQVNEERNYTSLLHAIYAGKVAILLEHQATALVLDIRGGEVRGIEEPYMERTLSGSREGFVERIQTNIGLIRRMLCDQNLIVEGTEIGERTRSDVALLYIGDIVDVDILAEVKSRLAKINIDGILASGTIEQFIEDNPYSIFPQTRTTERPNRVVAALLEGKIVIAVNGDPFMIILPALFVEFLVATESYFERAYVGSFIRLIRYLALIISLTLPSIFIALASFHHELMPYKLLLSFAQTRETVPWPVIINLLLMEVTIELLREGGLRLPTPIGQTMGVVGGIVLGQAAISSQIVTPLLLMVVALTALSSFAIPNYSMGLAIRVIRFPLMIATAMFGALGFALGIAVLFVHLTKLESFGVPYFAPLAPVRFGDWKDLFYRTFVRKMCNRPLSIPMRDRQRQGNLARGDERDEG